MNVTVKLFAAARDRAGADEVVLDLPSSATVADLRRQLAEEHSSLQPLLAHVLFAVDAQYAKDDTPLTEGCEVACIPPVSGG